MKLTTPELSKIQSEIHSNTAKVCIFQSINCKKKHEDPVGNENKCKQIPSKPKMRAEHKLFKLFVHGNRLFSLLGCYFQQDLI